VRRDRRRRGSDRARERPPGVAGVRAIGGERRVRHVDLAPVESAPAVHVSLQDAGRAQSLYTATLALPALPVGTFCRPADFGVAKRELSFRRLRLARPVGHARSRRVRDGDARGQRGFVLWRATDGSYWSTLSTTLGIDEASIYPYEPPTLQGPVSAG
jgi:hypothetical protein